MAAPLTTETPERRPKHYTTEEFAALIRVDPQTVRAGYSRNGNYQNLTPLKLPHHQLLWLAQEVDALLRGEFSSATTPPEAEQLGHECGAVLIDRLTTCASQAEAAPIISDFLVALGEERTTRFRRGAAIGAAMVLADVFLAGLAAMQERGSICTTSGDSK